MFRVYVSNYASFDRLQKNTAANRRDRMRVLARAKNACQAFFENNFLRKADSAEMLEPFRLQITAFVFVNKLNYSSVCRDLADAGETRQIVR
jgi:hypothetical protein